MEINQQIVGENKNKRALAYFSFLRTSSTIESQLKKTLKEFDLTHSQLNVLSILYMNHPETLSLKEVKEKLIVESPDLSRLVNRLLTKGWVDRSLCNENRRKVDLSLTKRGADVFERAHTEAKNSVHSYFKGVLSEKEVSSLLDILRKMRNSLNNNSLNHN